MKYPLCGFYIDNSIHQIGYIVTLIEKLNGILYTDSKISMHIIQEDYPSIIVRFYPDTDEIIKAMIKDRISILILQDFQYKKFSPLKSRGVKFVQIFHGTSDKTYNLNREIVNYDLVCLSGTKMLRDMEKRRLNRKGQCIVTGNPKTDLIFNKSYDRNEEIRKLGLDPDKINVLYAPTWMDKMGNSSFRKFGLRLANYFPEEYQLTIKLHPNLHRYKDDLVKRLKGSIKNKRNILLLEKRNQIYNIVPVLAASDILITDVSGVSHEYIAFLRPMIFFDNRNIIRFLYGRNRTRIWQTGDVVKRLKDLPQVIKTNVERPDRYLNIQKKILKEIYNFMDGKSSDRIIAALKALV